jgi:hypothetical protein
MEEKTTFHHNPFPPNTNPHPAPPR